MEFVPLRHGKVAVAVAIAAYAMLPFWHGTSGDRMYGIWRAVRNSFNSDSRKSVSCCAPCSFCPMHTVAFRRTVQRSRQASGVTPSGSGALRERVA